MLNVHIVAEAIMFAAIVVVLPTVANGIVRAVRRFFSS